MRLRLILVGAGHAHLEVIRLNSVMPLGNIEIYLISPSDYQYYSGMFSGYTEGLYDEDDIRINLRELTNKCGVNFIKKSASRVFPERKKLFCEDGAVYPFDLISFDLGSKSIPPEFVHSQVCSVKPNFQFVEQINEIRESSTPLVVGGGAAGCELALSIQAYKNNREIKGDVRIVTADKVLSSSSNKTSGKIKSLLERSGVQVWENERVSDIYDDYIETSFNNHIHHSGLLWLGGPIGEPIFQLSNLAVDEKGFAFITDALQFEKYSFMFGAGDCVTLRSYPNLDKSGVYAVRQGPILFENLHRYINNQPLQSYEPQKKALYILSTGGEKGLLLYGKFSHHSHQAWKLKNKIDTNFMKKYK
ncbi:FAD-dependent oxidoreductase [Halobacillus seohaensis]|uniref:FAD-dependent oxidoreductase n=1 Tax=Halobacillus seohaensis TaxID=447421 RepID=A0ABW2ERD5_9BACI